MSTKDWTGSPGQSAFSSASDQADQYREGVIAVILELKDRNYTTRRSSNGVILSTFQTQLFLTPASPNNSTLYRVLINGVNCDYTTDGSATQAELRDGMIAAINASSQAALVTATASGNNVLVTADVYTTFTHSVAAGPAAPITESTAVAGVAADVVLVKSDIVFGTETSQAHTWLDMKVPTGKGRPTGGVEHLLFINCNNANSDTTPQTLDLYLGTGTYFGGAGGSLTTKPTIAVGGFEGAVLQISFIPWVAATAGSFTIGSTDDGDLFFLVRKDATASIFTYVIIRDDLANAIGNYVLTLHAFGQASDAVVSTNLQNASQSRGLDTAGTANCTAITMASIAWVGMSSWTAGKESNTSKAPFRDIEVTNNASSASRQYGLLADIAALPANAVFNDFDTDDLLQTGGTPKLVCVGDIAVPLAGQLS